MPSVEIPGKIIAIEYEEGGGDYEIVTPSGWTGGSGNQVVTLDPTGKPRTVVILESVPAFMSGGPALKLASGFNIGDIVEIYRMDNGDAVSILDENNAGITSLQTAGAGFIMRKLKSGSANPMWGRVPN